MDAGATLMELTFCWLERSGEGFGHARLHVRHRVLECAEHAPPAPLACHPLEIAPRFGEPDAERRPRLLAGPKHFLDGDELAKADGGIRFDRDPARTGETRLLRALGKADVALAGCGLGVRGRRFGGRGRKRFAPWAGLGPGQHLLDDGREPLPLRGDRDPSPGAGAVDRFFGHPREAGDPRGAGDVDGLRDLVSVHGRCTLSPLGMVADAASGQSR